MRRTSQQLEDFLPVGLQEAKQLLQKLAALLSEFAQNTGLTFHGVDVIKDSAASNNLPLLMRRQLQNVSGALVKAAMLLIPFAFSEAAEQDSARTLFKLKLSSNIHRPTT